jgi:hypothetical protein
MKKSADFESGSAAAIPSTLNPVLPRIVTIGFVFGVSIPLPSVAELERKNLIELAVLCTAFAVRAAQRLIRLKQEHLGLYP